MNRDGIITCIRVLHALLLVDDEFADSERAFIERLIDGLGLDPADRDAASAPLDDIDAAVKTLPHALRKGQLEALVEGALADGEVDARERALIKRVAGVLEVSDEELAWIWEKNSR